MYRPDRASGLKLVMNAFEDFIDLAVSAPAIPPSFHDADVVPVNSDMLSNRSEAENGINEQLESDCFGPRNVAHPSESFPTWDKTPSPPSLADDDCDSHLGAGI